MIVEAAHWHWPQWTVLILYVFNLGVGMAMHGRPREPYNSIHTVISFSVSTFILACGGFFA